MRSRSSRPSCRAASRSAPPSRSQRRASGTRRSSRSCACRRSVASAWPLSTSWTVASSCTLRYMAKRGIPSAPRSAERSSEWDSSASRWRPAFGPRRTSASAAPNAPAKQLSAASAARSSGVSSASVQSSARRTPDPTGPSVATMPWPSSRSRSPFTPNRRRRGAASSMASGSPSRSVDSSWRSAGVPRNDAGQPAAFARSNRSCAPSLGDSGSSPTTTSPGNPVGARDVARTRSADADRSRSPTTWTASGGSCSRLSRTRSAGGARLSHLPSRSAGSAAVDRSYRRAAATPETTAAASRAALRSTNVASCSLRSRSSRATRSASRVFPTPAGPVTVTSRTPACTWSRSRARSRPRPMSGPSSPGSARGRQRGGGTVSSTDRAMGTTEPPVASGPNTTNR